MSNIEQEPSKELSKREAMNKALADAIVKGAHPFLGEKAEELQSILTRPLTVEDVKAAGKTAADAGRAAMHTVIESPVVKATVVAGKTTADVGKATIHTFMELPVLMVRNCFHGSENLYEAVSHLFHKENLEAVNHARQGVKDIVSGVIYPIAIPSQFRRNLKIEKLEDDDINKILLRFRNTSFRSEREIDETFKKVFGD
jgi:hypothetical protein